MVSPTNPAPLTIGSRTFEWGQRTYVVGIINATPDSFSGDGIVDPQAAVHLAERMVEAGADILDLGAESTRPEFAAIDAETEWGRLMLVLGAVRRAVSLPITVDTSKAEVARRALDYGADAINDVTGFLGDAGMARVVAQAGAPAILMHNQRGREFGGDVIRDTRAGFERCIAAAVAGGVSRERLILDPGFGFGWGPVQNFELLRRLGELRDLGRPLMIGTSRKSSIGYIIDRPAQEREWGTAATVALAIQQGVDLVRVHDVDEMVQVARVADAVVRQAVP
ncbi:MAG: dihydropteroate synthase [Chloroflexi bacterium HGW-Chloroflexi-9]|nr:MAG: dihydropteroate synthase [Chloroflexi bacterium HGW-Chloroflexi-9]